MPKDKMPPSFYDPEKAKSIPFWGLPVACAATGRSCVPVQCEMYNESFKRAMKYPFRAQTTMIAANERARIDQQLAALPQNEMSDEELAKLLAESREAEIQRAANLERRSKGAFQANKCHQIRIIRQA